MTDDGAIDIALADDMPARFRVSGWHVQEVDGHDLEAVGAADPAGEGGPAAVDDRLPDRHRPRHPGRGRHARRRTARASSRRTPTPHGSTWAGRTRPSRSRRTFAPPGARPGAAACRTTRRGRRGWRHCRRKSAASSTACGRDACRRAGKRRCATSSAARSRSGSTQPGIKTSGDIVDLLAEAIPELLSGAPDLEGATQHKRRLTAFTAADRGGRYVHYGIREHAMGAMLNGMAAHGGVVPAASPIWSSPTTCAPRCAWRP